ncbi:MAG: 50S ribosomal protein L25 [Candidatus Omnitrophica bacterium]|nr:50S ribosomal protein L25 [Candidatus Omnitrophota bacterium]
MVIIKEIQTEPLKGQVIHIDFNEVSLTKKIKVKVPVATKGEAKEVTGGNGVIEHTVWEVEVECLPMNIPEKLLVDIEGMKIGDTKMIKDLIVSEDIKVLNDPDLVIIAAKPPAKEEVKVEVPGEEAVEPEVIAKGKKPEEEEGEAPAADAAKPAQAPKEEKK